MFRSPECGSNSGVSLPQTEIGSARWSLRKIIAVGVGVSIVLTGSYLAASFVSLSIASAISKEPMDVLLNNPAALKYHEGLIAFGVGVATFVGLIGGAIATVGRATR